MNVQDKKELQARIKSIIESSLSSTENILGSVIKLTKEEKQLFSQMTVEEVRDAVDDYYDMQHMRINTEGRIRAIVQGTNEGNLPYLVRTYSNYQVMEENAKKALEAFAQAHPAGVWLNSILGIGPVISACLIAMLDIHEAPTAGHFWSYCGLNDHNRPWLGATKTKEIVDAIIGTKKSADITYEDFVKCCNATQWKAHKVIESKNNNDEYIFIKDDKYVFTKESIVKALSVRPYNNKLKCLCWKIGESFIKTQNRPKSIYGKLFAETKAQYEKNNENLMYEEVALEKATKVGKTTEAYKWYKKGMLPPAHITSRARRKTVQIFLAHFHTVLHLLEYGNAPEPYVVAHKGHKHILECPNLDLIKPYVKGRTDFI